MPRWPEDVAWSPAEIRQLRKLAGQHHAPRIAELLGRTTNAVRQKCKLLGIPLQKTGERHAQCRHPESLVERVRTMHDGGKSPRVIAAELGLNLGTVKSWCYFQTRQRPG